jgi:anti-sigma regulatory factor (Ser/Thr protein kinase)
MAIAASLRLSAGDHVVHFYDDAGDHVDTVCRHLGAALRAGDSVVIVAQPSRIDRIVAGLAEHGVDVSEARRSLRLVTADASAIMARFMVGRSPDAERFEAVVGDLLRSACADGGLHVYGEMVGLLWDDGNISAAIEVEDLWIRLSDHLSFSLVCCYHRSTSLAPAELDAFSEVCHRHSSVIDGAPVAANCDRYRHFERSTLSCRTARRFVADTIRTWDLDHLIADASLIVSELVANAVLHANSDLTVGLTRRPDTILIVVGDSSPQPPIVRRADPGAAGGRGLQLVAVLATRWGVDIVADGKLVWAELPIDRSGDCAHPATPMS